MNIPDLPMGSRESLITMPDGKKQLCETVPSYTRKMVQLANMITWAVMRGETPRPTKMLCIPRGGLTPTEIVARALGLKAEHVVSIGARTYTGVDQKGKLEIGQVPSAKDIEGQVLLIAEDIADTGETLEIVKSIVEPMDPAKIITAAVYEKGKCQSPDFCVARTDVQDRWVRLPFDGLDDFGDYFEKQMGLKPEQRDVANMRYDITVGLYLPSGARV